jgi:transcriptional regulator GlxA family with amidase domain
VIPRPELPRTQRHRHVTQALINSVKVQRTRKLLQSSRMTVARVAEAVGYQDATALRRVMKKVATVSPGRCRIPV